MQSYISEDIVAMATPVGRGALAIIRFSGQDLVSTFKNISTTRYE